jgi:hypothetical protein
MSLDGGSRHFPRRLGSEAASIRRAGASGALRTISSAVSHLTPRVGRIGVEAVN